MRLTRRTLIAAMATAPALAQTRRRVRIGQATPAVSFLPVMAARAFGSFAAAGLDLDWAAIPGGDPTALAALDAGDIDLAAVGSETLLNAIARGQPFQIVASLMSKVSLELVASNRLLDRAGVAPSDPLTKRLAALRGAVVGVSAVGGTQDRAARWLARQGGVDPRTGLQIALAGPPPAIQAALEAGRIDAFVLSPPEGLQAEDAGTGRVLVRMGDEFEQLRGVPSLVLAVRTPVDEARRALVSATLKVLQEASAQVLADPAAAASRIQQALFPRIKPAIMAAAIDSLRSGLVDRGRLGPEGITSLLRYAGDVAGDLGSRADDGGFWTNAYSDRPV